MPLEELHDDPLPPDEAEQTVEPIPVEVPEPDVDDPDLETDEDEDLGDQEPEEDPA